MKKLLLVFVLATSLVSATVMKINYASHYSDKFVGRKTANGEIFSQKKLTAATNNYPFGTKLLVINTTTNDSVIVKVNDRIASRFSNRIDLTKKAFKQIAPLSKGVVSVKVKPIKDGKI